MKKTIIGIVIVIAIIAIYSVSSYNSMVTLDEQVGTAWSNVENQYQRRTDLIPNLVSTVKGYAAHEQGTLTGVIEARAKASAATVNFDEMTSESFANFQAAQGELSQALGRLMVTVERYPDLKGEIQLSGAFALYPMVVRWAEEFRKIHPEVRIDISAGGAHAKDMP